LLLDWLAAEFVARKFSMKKMHRLMETSETYKRVIGGCVGAGRQHKDRSG
jgi:hypothetical protein